MSESTHTKDKKKKLNNRQILHSVEKLKREKYTLHFHYVTLENKQHDSIVIENGSFKVSLQRDVSVFQVLVKSNSLIRAAVS